MRIWPFSQIKDLKNQVLELEAVNAVLKDNLNYERQTTHSLTTELEEERKVNTKHKVHFRRVAQILSMKAGIGLFMMLFSVACFGQPVVRNVISTNFLNATFGAEIYATNINSADFFTPAGAMQFRDDFISLTIMPPWVSNIGASGGPAIVAGTSTHPGLVSVTTGVNVAGENEIYFNIPQKLILFDSDPLYFEWVVLVPTLSVNASDGFCSKLGFSDTSATGSANIPNNFVGFYYNDQTNANWVAAIRQSGGAISTLDTKLPVSTVAWANLGALITATGATFYTNHVSCGAIVAATPTGGGNEVGPTCQIVKITGTNSRQVIMDLFWFFKKFSTIR